MLEPNRAICREMTKADLELVLSWRNHPDVRRYMYNTHEITPEEHISWYRKASIDPKKHLLIYQNNNDPLGFVNITESNADGVADWGFYISPTAAKGTGANLGHTALMYAFNTLQLYKVCGNVLISNERSIHFHERLGFEREGLLRHQHFDGQNYIDVVCFALFAENYLDRVYERNI